MGLAPALQLDGGSDSRISDLGAVVRGMVPRSVVLVSADLGLRGRLKDGLTKMRWAVHEAGGGAEAIALTDIEQPEAMVVDAWLPDLEVGEFAGWMETLCPRTDLLRVDGRSTAGGVRSPRRNELLHALREAQEFPLMSDSSTQTLLAATAASFNGEAAASPGIGKGIPALKFTLPEMVGETPAMQELARLIRLVAPRTATVLIEGETGTGKEVVAKAVHRLSARAGKPFVVLNCAAIPESLLEAELFGHTRGAFTGAVKSRVGRIEAADGGTLFLDEIGEMPLALQAKMLRFLECGELQKVGENESVRVDVRVIAATHQELERKAEEKLFRLDLYHRLAVFPLEVPALRDRMNDLPLLVEFFLDQMARTTPRKTISAEAVKVLAQHRWPGNVRQLMHVLERASILSEDRAQIGVDDVQVRVKRKG